MKKQAKDWQNIFLKHIYEKGLISGTYKELSKLKSRNINNPIRKLGKRSDQTFHQRTDAYGKGMY